MINGKLSIDYVRTIVKSEMELDDDRINIYNQKWKIPPDDELFVVLEYKSTPRIISSRNYVDSVQVEHQDLNTQESIVIGLFSRNLSALQRKEEAVMGLYSVYSQQVQEANSFYIARGVHLEDLSSLEGAAQLNRIDISATIFAWYSKTKEVDYYEFFNVCVDVNS